MAEWEALLGITWPKNACDQSGECCRGAAQMAPWARLLRHAAGGDPTARAFLNQFVPYADLEAARQNAPHALEASMRIAQSRGESTEGLVLYHCRYLEGRNLCRIYEDRPQLCRDFPESPFGAVPACCGYAEITRTCHQRIAELRAELADLKKRQSMLESNPETD